MWKMPAAESIEESQFLRVTWFCLMSQIRSLFLWTFLFEKKLPVLTICLNVRDGS